MAERTPVDDAVRTLVRTGHTRAPVYRERLDDADRTVVLLDLVGCTGAVGDHASAAVVLPESMRLVGAVRALQAGDQLELAGWRITAMAMDGHAITRLHLEPAAPAGADPDG